MSEEMKRSGFVSIIGRPNVGKSTLLNALVGQKIAITSDKPQTTREKIRGILTRPEGQIVFVDTPGMIEKAGNRLGEYMIYASRRAVGDCDVIVWLIEPSAYIGKEDRAIAKMLEKSGLPVILVINKIDTVPRDHLLPVIDAWKELYPFREMIPVSALRDRSFEDLVGSIFRYLPYGPAYFDEDTVTDKNVRELCAEMIHEKALHALRDEVPHGLAVVIESMQDADENDPVTRIEAAIICEKDSHKSIVIGKGGSMLKKIGTNARYEIEKMLDEKVFLKLYVKVRSNWRDDLTQVRSFGYDKRDL